MSTSRSSSLTSRLWAHARILIDAITYAVVTALIATLVALTLGIVTGGGFVRGKQLLFVFGWVVMAYATFKLWPSPSDAIADPAERDARPGESIGKSQSSRWLERIIQSTPPNRWIDTPHPSRRMSLGGKLFLASLVMLLISLLMEVVWDIG